MKRLPASLLALGLAVAAGTAPAQTHANFANDPGASFQDAYPDRYGNSSGAIYDYARVVRVDPVIDGYRGGYASTSGQRCYDSYTDAYGNDPYRNDGHARDPYYPQRDPYYPQRGSYGTQTGATVATVIGGIAGAVLGSKIGGGSGSTAAAAVGAMAGGMVGRQVYENNQRNRYASQRTGTVRVCDPVPARDGYTSYPVGDGRVTGYDVTYEYAGRTFRTRTDYHPGDRIRVRVDVRPE
jgi:uncharacterized protein YcfJ